MNWSVFADGVLYGMLGGTLVLIIIAASGLILSMRDARKFQDTDREFLNKIRAREDERVRMLTDLSKMKTTEWKKSDWNKNPPA